MATLNLAFLYELHDSRLMIPYRSRKVNTFKLFLPLKKCIIKKRLSYTTGYAKLTTTNTCIEVANEA